MIGEIDLLDSLINRPDDQLQLSDDEIIIPKRCSVCKSALICSVLPTFATLSKIGICVGVEKCPCFEPLKKKQ